MENDEPDERLEKPPGHFMEETYETDTKRFVEQARELARRRGAPGVGRGRARLGPGYGATTAQTTTTFRPQPAACAFTSCADAVQVVAFAR